MDRRLLQAYNAELRYLRTVGKEFGADNPEVAGRLGLGDKAARDPYAERLLEGVAFLSARVRLKLDEQFPEFTQHLLHAIQPDYVAPTPSMCIAAFEAKTDDATLAAGERIVRRGTPLQARVPESVTPCTFETGRDVALLPLEIAEVEVLPNEASVAAALAAAKELAAKSRPDSPIEAESGLRIRFRTGVDLADIKPGLAPIFIAGEEGLPGALYRQILGETVAVVARTDARGAPVTLLPTPAPIGFEADAALLPTDGRSFAGYRLVKEYFAFPEKFLFFALPELERAFAAGGKVCDVTLLFRRRAGAIGGVGPANLRLHCAPAINLFKKRLGRSPVRKYDYEHAVLTDREKPKDFEVYRVLEVEAHVPGEGSRPVAPLYAFGALLHDWSNALFHKTRLEPRRLPRSEREALKRADYASTETLLSLQAPGDPELLERIRDISVEALVTNRDLPKQLIDRLPNGSRDGGGGRRDGAVSCETGEAVSIIVGPTRPQPPLGMADAAWRVIGGLTPNYASLVNQPEGDPGPLRNHLGLFGAIEDQWDGVAVQRQVNGIHRVSAEPVTRRVELPATRGADRRADVAFVRGQRVRIVLDESAYDRERIFLFASVLDRFLSEFATVNTFIETVFEIRNKGVFAAWPPKVGQRPTI